MTNPDADTAPERVAEALVQGGVLVETEDGFGVAESFTDAVERTHEAVEELDETAVEDRIEAAVDDEDQRALVTEVGTDDREFLALYLTLTERLPTLPAETRIRVVPLLQGFRGSPPREEGSPEAFVPIHGDRLRTVTRLFPRSIVYVYLDDCEPCDELHELFDEMFPEPPEGIELFSVYGPDYAEYLHHEYDVKGGPVTLFMLRDTVDSRVFGVRHERVFEGEVKQLRESEIPQ